MLEQSGKLVDLCEYRRHRARILEANPACLNADLELTIGTEIPDSLSIPTVHVIGVSESYWQSFYADD
jgi:hypothetical protein